MTETRKIWHWVVLALLSLIWGTSYILMKKGLESFSYFQVGSLRIFITFIALLPIALKNIPKLNRENILQVLLIGYLGNAIPAYLFPLAQTGISSSMAGMLNSLSPVFTLLLGVTIYNRKIIKTQFAGVFLGLAGAVGLIYNGSFSFNMFGMLVVLATLFYGISSNEVSKVKGINGLQLTSLAFFVISPVAIIYLIFSDFSAAMETANWIRNLGYIAILAVVGSATALAMFYLLIKDTSPVFAAMVTYFTPVVSTMWGIADDEKLTTSMVVSVVFIIAGASIINRPDIFMKRNKRIK